MGKYFRKSNCYFDGKILIADFHRAQQTNGVKELLKKKKTSLFNVPPGCTYRVQVVDVPTGLLKNILCLRVQNRVHNVPVSKNRM